MNLLFLNYRHIFYCLTIFLCISFPVLIFGQYPGQYDIEYDVEGKKYKNQETGLTIQYGNISEWNTFGITFTNKNGVKFYYINCSINVSSDRRSMVIYDCRNLNDQSSGRIYFYPNKVIQSGSDGQIVYELVENNYADKEVSRGMSNFSTVNKGDAYFEEYEVESEYLKMFSSFINKGMGLKYKTMIINGYEILYYFGDPNYNRNMSFSDAEWFTWFVRRQSNDMKRYRLPSKDEMLSILKAYGNRNPEFCCDWWTSTPVPSDSQLNYTIKFDRKKNSSPLIYETGKGFTENINVWLIRKISVPTQKSNTTGTKSSTSPPKPSASSTGIKKPITPSKK